MLTHPTDLVNALGYLGIFLLIFVFPFPQELVLPLAGFVVSQGRLNLMGVVLSGVMGSAFGAVPWYWAGRYFGEERLSAIVQQHTWIKFSPQDVRRAKQWFDRSGTQAVMLSQFIPLIRMLISLPAGMSRMNFGLFMLCLVLGAGVWQGLLAYAGYLLGSQYWRVNQYGSWYRIGIVVCLAIVVIGLIRRKKML